MSDPFLAEIRIVSFTFAPKGWAFCNGQLLRIDQNQALFSLLGTTYGGDGPVVNPSGGLISKGHPLGATGLAQCSELTWQLRGQADARQVDGAKIALQHNLGLGGACVVTMYRKADFS